MSSFDRDRMKLLLEQSQSWPGAYTFKFIVAPTHEDRVRALLPEAKISVRASKNGKYVAVTLVCHMESPDAVLDVHMEANQIEGLISL